mmetsp:Transcript_36348/g.116741  ORF Transcript_36348/g.116741 Transcript_36348/m.116741 type:complete len:266 (-) Transcript_36348:1007-1804(-)
MSSSCARRYERSASRLTAADEPGLACHGFTRLASFSQGSYGRERARSSNAMESATALPTDAEGACSEPRVAPSPLFSCQLAHFWSSTAARDSAEGVAPSLPAHSSHVDSSFLSCSMMGAIRASASAASPAGGAVASPRVPSPPNSWLEGLPSPRRPRLLLCDTLRLPPQRACVLSGPREPRLLGATEPELPRRRKLFWRNNGPPPVAVSTPAPSSSTSAALSCIPSSPLTSLSMLASCASACRVALLSASAYILSASRSCISSAF